MYHRPLRIDPEFHHAARAMEGIFNISNPLPLSGVAQIDNHHVIALCHFNRFGRIHLANAGLGVGNHLGACHFQGLGHGGPPVSCQKP